MKKVLAVIIIAVVLCSFIACKKKESSTPQTPINKGPIMDSPLSFPKRGEGQKIEFNVVVPTEVQDKWSGVKLLVEDKETQTTNEFTVNIGDALTIPDSKISILVKHFLPDFKMNGPVITSASNTPNNPSVGIIISEDGKQIFPETGKFGWLYSKFPTVHPFQHERYGLTLVEGVEKK